MTDTFPTQKLSRKEKWRKLVQCVTTRRKWLEGKKLGEAHKATKQACYVIGEEWAACRPQPAHVRSYRGPLITFPINYGQLKAERCHFSGYRWAADTGTTGTCPAAARRGFLCRGTAGVTNYERGRLGMLLILKTCSGIKLSSLTRVYWYIKLNTRIF